jgi:asparagine synthase (glutamine-hydrolysing)
MCGIAGIVTRQGALPDEGLLRRMSACIAHRGPDGDGIWVAPGVGLAHRRLAIIDLNPTGAQPMQATSPAGFVAPVLTIVFNGEIYNYRELRTELEARGASFRTSSDTEVILESYRAWGIESLQKLRGMFAFALWDAEKKSLLLARDRIGKKPLYIGFTPLYDLVFASELKALAPAIDMKPDWNAVRSFLGLQYVPSPMTGFRDVFQLEPGTYGIWDKEGWKTGRYHSYQVGAPLVGALDGMPAGRAGARPAPTEIDERIRFLLDEAVKIRQLAADVPVGAFLSGGIDSAAIVAYASKHVDHLQTFTMGFDVPHMDERSEARALATAFKTEHHEFLAKPDDILALVDELVRHYDAPYADSSALPLWLLARETSKHIKVVLTGDGGDELFGGYRRYVAYERALRLPRMSAPLFTLAGKLSGDAKFTRMADVVRTRSYGEMFCGSYFNTEMLRQIFAPEFLADTDASDAVRFVERKMVGAPLAGALAGALAVGRTGQAQGLPLQAGMFFDLTSYLPDDLNVKMDRATMRWGLEARAPFLDQELVAFALTLPLKQKVYHGKTKVALKRALKGIVPDDVLNRKKRGFQVPLAEWFRGPLRKEMTNRLLDPHAPLAQIVDQRAVTRLIAENDRGADHGNRLWMLLTLSSWLSYHV